MTLHALELTLWSFFWYSLTGTLLLLAALGLTRLMRSASSSARHAVLATSLAAFLVLPLAGAFAPPWTVPVLPAAVMDWQAQAPLPGGFTRAASQSSRDAETPPGAALRDGHALPPRELGTAAPASNDSPPWRAWLLLIWIGGFAVIGTRLMAGVIGVWLLSRRATMVTDGGWLQAAHRLAQRLGLARGVTLLRGDRGSVPMTWGVLQPVVWLPAAAEQWNAGRRTAVLAHELAHVRRRDAITQWLANAALALHWFNPLVWIAARQLRMERERACDDAVLELGTKPTEYAEHLLEMVRAAGRSGGPAAAMAMARRSQFEGRLLAILDDSAPRSGVGAARVIAAGCLAALLVLPLAGMRPRVTMTAGQAPQPVIGLFSEQDDDLASQMITDGAVNDAAAVEARHAPPAASAGTSGNGDTVVQLPAAMAQERDTTLLLDVVRAAAQINSSADRAKVLARVARVPDLDHTVVSALADAAAATPSTAERARVIRTIIAHQPTALTTARHSLLKAVVSVTSSAEQANLWIAALRAGPGELALADIIGAASVGISSSAEKSRVLVTAARNHRLTGPARAAYIKAADTISSGPERARALSALLDSGEERQPDAEG